jgi:predicted transcriptional regulator
MIARDLINPIIPALDVSDDIARASSLMDDLHLSVLPVLENEHFQGFIQEDVLYDDIFDKPTVGEYPLQSIKCVVNQDQHFYEILRLTDECQHLMIAVIDKEKYLGVITAKDLVMALSKTTAVQSPGSILELSIKKIDYSLAEITRLIEGENAKIMGCFLTNDEMDSQRVYVTLKLDKKDVSHIAATLKRFDYKLARIIQEESLISYEKERLDALMKYLSI